MRMLAAAILISTAGTAAAQSPVEDVRCLFASNLFTQTEKDPAKREVARISGFFYMGRIDARMSGAELKTTIAEQAKTIDSQNVGPLMTNCVKSMQGKLTAMQAIGGELKQPAK